MLLIAPLITSCGGGNGHPRARENRGRVPAVIKVGSEIPYPPFEFGRAPYRGFDVDVVNEIARRLHARARFINTPFNSIFRDLGQHRFDMVAAGAEITSAEQPNVSFSDPYLPADLALVVTKGSDVKTKDDLADKTVGAQRGSAGADYATSHTKATSVRTYAVIDDALNALSAGQVNAVIHDYPISRYEARRRGDLRLVETISTGSNYGFAFPRDSALESRVDVVLGRMKRDGTYARLYRKWFRSSPPKGFAPTSQ